MLLISLLFASLSIPARAQEAVDCDWVFDFMYGKWATVKNLQYSSNKIERHGEEVITDGFDFTVQRSPFKVAGRMVEKGHYILYDKAANPNQAHYISNGFPFTNLTLDIQGKMFRGMNHYTISDAGCEFIFGIIRKQYELMPESFWCEKIVRNGKEEYAIQASTDDWHYRDYAALDGETVNEIADKLNVSAYLIIENNPGLTSYVQDCSGLVLKVPSHYGKQVKLHIDAQHGLPTLIEVYDEKGLVGRYEYRNYKINVRLPDDYFTVSYLDALD